MLSMPLGEISSSPLLLLLLLLLSLSSLLLLLLLLSDYPWKSLARDAQLLKRYLWSRHPPLESEEVRMKQHQLEEGIKERGNQPNLT